MAKRVLIIEDGENEKGSFTAVYQGDRVGEDFETIETESLSPSQKLIILCNAMYVVSKELEEEQHVTD